MTTELIRPKPEAAPVTSAPLADRGRTWITAERIVLAGYLALAVFLMIKLWLDPYGRHHSANPGDDQVLFEWMLGHTAHAITHGESLFHSALLNAPDGANLMGNTSVIAIGILLTPVTLLFGAPMTYVLAMTAGLFGTAAGWYYLMRRHLRLGIVAAAVGGGLCGFGPSTVAHANGHLNFTALLLVPFIVIAVLRLAEPGNAVRGGFTLAGLLIVQIFIGEEVVFLIAIFMAVFVAVYACNDWARVKPLVRRFLAGLGIAGGVSLAVLAYPLWVQFLGPGSYSGIPWHPKHFPTDLASFMAFPSDSLGGRLQLPGTRLRHNVTEENTFYGLPLVALTGLLVLMFFKRHKALRSLSITALIFAIVSLGSHVRVNGAVTSIPGPYALLRPLPLFDSTIPTRFSLLCLPVIAILVAYGLQRVARKGRELRLVWYLAFGLALLPLIPLPPNTHEREPVPEFFSHGQWREYVADQGTLVPVPIPELITYDGQRWQEAADYGFKVPLGAFIGPDANGNGKWSGDLPPTARLIMLTMNDGTIPEVDDDDRAQAVADLKRWEADAVVVGPHEFRPELSELMTKLLGPAHADTDVTVWDINPTTGKVEK